MRILWGIRKGKEAWQEELITECEERIAEATIWAKSNGFDRLRVSDFNGEKPDFSKVLE